MQIKALKIFIVWLFLLIGLIMFSCSKTDTGTAVKDDKLQTKETQDIVEIKESSPSSKPEMTETDKQKTQQPSSGLSNSPPSITKIRLMPEVFRPGDILYIEAETADPDGDGVVLFYEWYKNGELVSTEKRLNASIKRGDKLMINIKPFDGKDYGKVISLDREILNVPPIIIDHNDYHIDKDLFTYQVKASDPDGDTLTYTLKSAPEGMTIDEKGLIRWNIPHDFKGKASITVSVSDGHGGEAKYSFELTIGLK